MVALALCLALLTAACGVCLALWPIRDLPPPQWYSSYDRASSSLDVAALSVCYAVLVAALLHLSRVAKPGQDQLQRRHKRLKLTIAAASWLASLLLLAKAVIVGLEASDRLWPHGRGAVGLVFMCAFCRCCRNKVPCYPVCTACFEIYHLLMSMVNLRGGQQARPSCQTQPAPALARAGSRR